MPLPGLAARAACVIQTLPIMNSQGLTLFARPIGHCGLAWGDNGVVGVQLPQDERGAHPGAAGGGAFPTRLMPSRRPRSQRSSPPSWRLLEGEPIDLTGVVLDEDVDCRRSTATAWAVARTVPPGQTITYGEIAARLGDPHAARAVGRAMGANPFPIIVPCHRVLGADGRMGGFSAAGGVEAKARLLSIERARTDGAPMLFQDLPITVKPPLKRRQPGS